ncbi:hypothetical protein HWV62_27395 [Athelia sp. TMB]|nr:hypothetical protein HWV62_27395 [Athelia sp. TMB]
MCSAIGLGDTCQWVKMDRTDALIVLLLVCKYWKNILLTTTSLWASVMASPVTIGDAELMATWLQRSGRSPLDLHFTAHDNDIADVGLDIILRHKSHWGDITIDWSNRSTLAPRLVSPFITAPTPLLWKFELLTNFDVDCAEEDSGVANQLATLLGSSPKLLSLCWYAQQYYHDGKPVRLQGLTLKHLRLLHLTCMISILECSHILRQIPLLEVCNLGFVENREGSEPLINEAIVLLKLREFALQTDENLSSFFRALQLPSLTHLTVVFRHNNNTLHGSLGPFHEWPQASFMSFLTRSACSLSRLSLIVPIAEDDLLECLDHVSPTLESLILVLKFDWPTFGNRTLALLTEPVLSQRERKFPKLKVITFFASLGEVAPHALADMVESRWCFPEDEFQFENPDIVAFSIHGIPEEDQRRIRVMALRGKSGKITCI